MTKFTVSKEELAYIRSFTEEGWKNVNGPILLLGEPVSETKDKCCPFPTAKVFVPCDHSCHQSSEEEKKGMPYEGEDGPAGQDGPLPSYARPTPAEKDKCNCDHWHKSGVNPTPKKIEKLNAYEHYPVDGGPFDRLVFHKTNEIIDRLNELNSA